MMKKKSNSYSCLMFRLSYLLTMWKELNNVTSSEDFKNILNFLKEEIRKGKKLAPHKDNVFRVFKDQNFNNVKVVILGQDPYPTPGHANGLAFATNASQTPKSLQNIFKEIEMEYGSKPKNNDLLNWQKQGVFLLNTSLSTLEGETFAHKKIWQSFTDAVIRSINDRKDPVVFMLWGKPAQDKAKLITNPKHLILMTSHPSPLSAHRGFLGSNIFKQCNDFLEKHRINSIDWTKS